MTTLYFRVLLFMDEFVSFSQGGREIIQFRPLEDNEDGHFCAHGRGGGKPANFLFSSPFYSVFFHLVLYDAAGDTQEFSHLFSLDSSPK
jgi:hypothetical protein